MVEKLKGLFLEEEGQGMTEYGLVLGVIAVGVIGLLVMLKDEIFKMFDTVVKAIKGETTTT